MPRLVLDEPTVAPVIPIKSAPRLVLDEEPRNIPEIRQAPPKTITETFKSLLPTIGIGKTPEEQIAKDQADYVVNRIAEERKVSPKIVKQEVQQTFNFPQIDFTNPVDRKRFALDQAFAKGLAGTDYTHPDIAEEHPVLSAIGNGAGELMGLAATQGILSPVTSKLVKAAITKYGLRQLPKIMLGTRALSTAAAFGLKETGEKTLKGLRGEEITGADIKDIGKDLVFGAGLGITGSIAKPLLRIPAEMLYGYTISKIQGASNLEAAINAGVFGVFGLLNRADLNKEYRLMAIADVSNNLINKAQEFGLPPGVAKQQVEEFIYKSAVKTTGERDINKAFDKILADKANNLRYFDELNRRIKNLKQKTGYVAAPPEAGAVTPVKSEIQPQFTDSYAPELLDYLARYIDPKIVATLTGEERLALANVPVEQLRDFALNPVIPKPQITPTPVPEEAPKAPILPTPEAPGAMITPQVTPTPPPAEPKAPAPAPTGIVPGGKFRIGFKEYTIAEVTPSGLVKTTEGKGYRIATVEKALAEAPPIDSLDNEDYWGEQIANVVKDPRNITKEEWTALDPIYKKFMDAEAYAKWENAKQVAEKIATEKGIIITGPGEITPKKTTYNPLVETSPPVEPIEHTPSYPQNSIKSLEANPNQDNRNILLEDIKSYIDKNAATYNEYKAKVKELPELQPFIDEYKKAVESYNKFSKIKPPVERYTKPRVEKAIKEISEPQITGGVAPGAQASFYGTNIDDFEAVGAEGSPAEFKLFEKVKELTHKYAKRVGEKYTGKRAGLFYPDTKNIFLQALNNLSVAIHEITHYLDDKFKIVAPLMEITGETSTGNPVYDPATAPMRKALTDVYERFYPGGKRSHKLIKRLTEGIATFIEKYIERPTQMTYDYPLLVKEFLSANGKYHDLILDDFIRDAKAIIREHQTLDPLSKVKSRVVSAGHNFDIKSFLNLKEKIYTEICDNVYPMEKLEGDLHLWIRFYRTIAGFIANNIIEDKGYHTLKEGKFIKLYDYNWGSLIKKLHEKGSTEDFGAWLFARDTHYQYENLKKMKQGIVESLMRWAQENKKPLTEEQAGRKAENMPEYKEKALILEKNGVTQEVAEKAYLDHKDRFAEEAKMYDVLVRADLDLLHDPEVQLVNYDKYYELSTKEGYASLKRDVYNEILGVPTEVQPVAKPKAGKTKVSSLISRRGSALAIINPLFNGVQNHNEIMRKAVRQIVYNKLFKVSGKYPELFQRLKVETTTDKFGRILFPQEKDPNIIMARQDYKRVALLCNSKEIKQVLDEVLVHLSPHIVEKALTRFSSLFTKGTTGLYIPFAVTNILRDQFTAAALTKNDIIPLYTPLIDLFKEVLNHDSAEAKFLVEYLILGGERQTLANWLDLPPDKFFREIAREKGEIRKVLEKIVETGEFALGWLSKTSELLTRAAEYIKARQSGKTQLEALEDAARVSAPFSHIGRLGGGTIGRTVVKSIPFFNPAIQAISQFIRYLFDANPKTRKRALFVLGTVTAFMVSSMYWLRKYGTKEQKDKIKGIHPAELASYIWFPHPNGKDLIKLPIPQEMGVFGNLVNMLVLDQLEDAHYQPGEYIDAATAWLPDQLNPTDVERFIVSWIPQVAKPALEIALNKKTYPKITPLESELMKELPKEERYTERTSKLGKLLGNKIGIGSPIQWDHFIEGYLGRTTKFATLKSINNPLVREVYTLSMRQVENYYETKQCAEQQMNILKKDPNRFTVEERNKIRNNYIKTQVIANEIKEYRKIYEKDKNDTRLDNQRTKILDEIDSLY